jgi:hypothetical protein
MSKRNKTISLDEEIIEELKGSFNSSSLINELLKNYFGNGSMKAKDEIKTKLVALRREVFEKNELIINLEDQLDRIRSKEREVESKMSKIPQEIIDDIKHFVGLSEEGLINRYQNIYLSKYKVSYEDVKEAYDLFHKEE